MKRALWLPTVLLTVWLVATASSREIYVSPTGSDADVGSREKPLATISAAKQQARRLPNEPVTIYLATGTYYLDAPIVFEDSDSRDAQSPLLITALPNDQPVISGGLKLQLDWKPWRENILQAEVAQGIVFDQLFINGQRQHMARWPNYDAQAQYFQGFSAACTSPERTARWQQPAGGFLHAMHRSLWGDMHWEITGKTPTGELELIGGWQNNRQMGAHQEYRFVENIFEELDAPGEWYLDSNRGRLYFYPPAGLDLNRAHIEAVRLKHLIEFRGNQQRPVSNISLQNITFTHTARTFMENREPLLRSDWTTYRGGAILLQGAVDCTVRDCVLDQVGGNGIFISNHNRRITISGCRISEAGASAISFVGSPNALRSPLFEYHQTQTLAEMDTEPGSKSADYPADCLVDDCLIYLNGRVEKQTAGVNICMAATITVRNCSIYDCPRAGINICDGAFGGHVIEFCDVFDTVKETGDHGSFNSWGRDRFWHPDRRQTAEWVEQYPDMPRWDCQETNVLRNNRWRCDHGWDIDLDDGSSNYEIYNNLCLAGGIKLREGYDRNVYNNIMVDYTFCPHVWYPKCRTTFQHNIIWQPGYAPAGMKTTDQGQTVDYNLVHQPGASTQPATALQAFGGDQHSVLADAQFVDPSSGNYSVQQGSPALELGFRNFPMDQFGVRSPRLRAIAKTPPLPGTLAAASVTSGGWGRRPSKPKTADWLGARVKELETDGEMSAVGLGDKNGLLVVVVKSGSTAALAGLQENDVIRTANGRTLTSLGDLAEVSEQHKKKTPKLRLEVWRNQAIVPLDISAQ